MAEKSVARGNLRIVKTTPLRSRKRTSTRLVAAGDTLAKPGARAAEANRVARRTSTTQTVQQLQSVIGGASPDELKALRRTLFAKPDGAATGTGPDLELSAGWREGAYPYKNLMSRRSYEKQKFRLQARGEKTGQRVVIPFEGRDATGKGGTCSNSGFQ